MEHKNGEVGGRVNHPSIKKILLGRESVDDDTRNALTRMNLYGGGDSWEEKFTEGYRSIEVCVSKDHLAVFQNQCLFYYIP